MTLTTERQQFESWFTKKYPRSHWGTKKTASGEYQGGLTAQLWEVWQESRGCMANREAQPVALVDRRPAASGSICWQNGGKDLPHGTELFTAPPAPAVNASPDFETWFVEKYKQPERLVKNEDDTYKFAGVQMAFSAWVDVRAAMLAQPVSSGYKLPEGWIPCSERMPELDKRVLLYFGSYDGHIEDGCIGDDGDGPYHYFFDGDSLQQEPTNWMPLPAAPEGGNGA
ncbi:DUF551 domain-containing protein [Serratia marcescens]|uniref:DUF551 domain-containing protein n=1 Tax=Serratia marcescens TaxID=615 RepID=UPI0037D721A9